MPPFLNSLRFSLVPQVAQGLEGDSAPLKGPSRGEVRSEIWGTSLSGVLEPAHQQHPKVEGGGDKAAFLYKLLRAEIKCLTQEKRISLLLTTSLW